MNRKNAKSDLSQVDEESQLSPIQQSVLASIMAGHTWVDAAAQAGITDRTIRRWRESCPVFESALRSQVDALRESVAVQATVAMQTAMKSLIEIAADPSHPRAISAIRMIIDLNGPLRSVSLPSSVEQVSQEQSYAAFERIAARLS